MKGVQNGPFPLNIRCGIPLTSKGQPQRFRRQICATAISLTVEKNRDREVAKWRSRFTSSKGSVVQSVSRVRMLLPGRSNAMGADGSFFFKGTTHTTLALIITFSGIYYNRDFIIDFINLLIKEPDPSRLVSNHRCLTIFFKNKSLHTRLAVR